MNIFEHLNQHIIQFLENEEKLFEAELTDEAEQQLFEIPEPFKERITIAMETFEKIGTKYKHLNDLGKGLFELKPNGVRAYFKYHPNKRKIIVIGFICRKETQKAPERYKKQARKNIQNYLDKENK